MLMARGSHRGRSRVDRRAPAGTLTFVALAGYAAAVVTLLVHELGNGLTAALVGGRFHDFFVTPPGGWRTRPRPVSMMTSSRRRAPAWR